MATSPKVTDKQQHVPYVEASMPFLGKIQHKALSVLLRDHKKQAEKQNQHLLIQYEYSSLLCLVDT